MKRRSFVALGALSVGLGGLVLGRNELFGKVLSSRINDAVRLSSSKIIHSDHCVLTPEQEEGPFFFHAPLRSDIREDRRGLSFQLKVRIVDAEKCMPVEGAVVEVWHCDAQGQYSGYPQNMSRKPFDTVVYVARVGEDGHVDPQNSSTYLRGAQRSDGDGMVEFATIFPGWYAMRVTHVHVKVHANGRTFLTTQLYFPDDFVNEIYATHPEYIPHGMTPYTHNNDMVLGKYPDGAGLLLEPDYVDETLVAGVQFGV